MCEWKDGSEQERDLDDPGGREGYRGRGVLSVPGAAAAAAVSNSAAVSAATYALSTLRTKEPETQKRRRARGADGAADEQDVSAAETLWGGVFQRSECVCDLMKVRRRAWEDWKDILHPPPVFLPSFLPIPREKSLPKTRPCSIATEY